MHNKNQQRKRGLRAIAISFLCFCSYNPQMTARQTKPITAKQTPDVFARDGIRPGVFYYGDNLEGMQKMPDACIDLIYLDPPFNSKKQWSGMVEWRDKMTEVAFSDTWTINSVKHEWFYLIQSKEAYQPLREVAEAVRITAGENAYAYILYMAIRLIEMRRILKDTGSIYYHCDPVMSHSVKLMMDAIFGLPNFRNEIVWCYRTGGVSKRWFGRKHDTLLFYVKDAEAKYAFNLIKEKSYLTHKYGFANIDIQQDEGGYYTKTHCRDHWAMDALRGNQPETVGYPTQKPETLLERIILASTNEGDVVLDPFAGSGTTCAIAEKLNRRRIGMDLNREAADISTKRLRAIIKSMSKEEQKRRHSFFYQGGKNAIGVRRQTAAKAIANAKDMRNVLDKNDKEVAAAHRKKLKDAALRVQHGRCLGCGIWSPDSTNFHCEHIYPKSRGGLLTQHNTQALCGNCNSIKGSGTMRDLWRKLVDKKPHWGNDFWRLVLRAGAEKNYAEEDMKDADKRRIRADKNGL
ncbi:MAG: DNA methyltransferase [Gammaproteobacteria bacterium]